MTNTTALKALQLKARHQVYTFLNGHHLSKLYAQGYDFAQLREYQQGDDIRKINWTISAKLQKPYIKELHTNRELSVVVASLMDGSLYFGKTNKKQQKLTEIATLLAYATQQNNDLFTGITFTQNATNITPPTKQLYQLNEFSNYLYNIPLLETKLSQQKALHQLFIQLHKPSLLFILSDFLEEIDLSILAQKHEVILIIIRDEEEEKLPKLGETILQNPHNGTHLETYISSTTIHAYHTQLKMQDEALFNACQKNKIRVIKIKTNEEAITQLIKLFR